MATNYLLLFLHLYARVVAAICHDYYYISMTEKITRPSRYCKDLFLECPTDLTVKATF